MKIKTSELTGPALDWAVAKAMGLRPAAMVEPDCGHNDQIEARENALAIIARTEQ